MNASPSTGSNHHEPLHFDLLKAVGLTISENEDLSWSDPKLAARLLRCSISNLPSTKKTWLAKIHSEDRRDYARLLASLGWDGARYETRYRIHTDDDRILWFEAAGQRLSDNGALTAVIRDITDSREKEDRAIWLSQHDGATGLPNRDSFLVAANTLIGLSQRLSAKGALIRIRITNLDDVNLIYGFEAGERLLSAMAERLRHVVKSPDCLGKDNATDFLLGVLGVQGPDADPQVLSERLHRALTEAPYITPQGRLVAKVEIGHTIFPQATREAEDLLVQTQRAIQFEASKTVTAYAPVMGVPQTPQSTAFKEADIIAALNERRITLAYQPIIHARSRELHHYECLLRLRQEDGELVSAGRLIMAAETLGLAHLLDRRALELAGQKLQKEPEIRLALNVSAETVKSEETADDYVSALKALGPVVDRITLELTETAALNDPAKASAFSNETRALGCEFAIDDFGSGYTSFRNLMAIEAETIKIDGSLIKGIATTPHMQSFVRMMVDLAQTFSVKTVAEMVEDPADAEILTRLGVDYLQGYLFGVPSAEPSYQS
jgi:diguanylate cyclase (GGDEF)-like protein